MVKKYINTAMIWCFPLKKTWSLLVEMGVGKIVAHGFLWISTKVPWNRTGSSDTRGGWPWLITQSEPRWLIDVWRVYTCVFWVFPHGSHQRGAVWFLHLVFLAKEIVHMFKWFPNRSITLGKHLCFWKQKYYSRTDYIFEKVFYFQHKL